MIRPPALCLLRRAAWALLALIPTTALAQNNSLKGKFEDIITRAAVSGVQVTLKSFADTTEAHKVTAKDDGTFEVTGLGEHSYKLEALRLGYSPLRIVIRVTKKNQEAGVLGLTPESIPISGVTVTESPAPAAILPRLRAQISRTAPRRSRTWAPPRRASRTPRGTTS